MRGGAITKELDLGGETRTIRFDYNAIAEMEGVLGGGFATLAGAELGARTIRALVWAGLVAQQMYAEGNRYRAPKVGLGQVGLWLQDADGDEVQQVIIDLIMAGLPEQEEGDGEDADAPDPLAQTEAGSAS